MVSLLFSEGDQGAKYNIEKNYYKYIYVTLSVKTQLKVFFCDLLFSAKYHPSYDKEHSVKV